MCRVAALVDVLQLDSWVDSAVESSAWSVSGATRSLELTVAILYFVAFLAAVAVPSLYSFLRVTLHVWLSQHLRAAETLQASSWCTHRRQDLLKPRCQCQEKMRCYEG